MSIFSTSSTGGKKSWTKGEIKLMVGLKLLGAKTEDIAVACSHPKLSVDYKFRALKSKYLNNEGELLKFLGVSSTEELKQYAKDTIADAVEDDSTDEDVA
jgi:hypothetical protein